MRVKISARSIGFAAQHVDEDRRLGGAVDADDALFDALHRRSGRRDRDLDRIAQHMRGEIGDGARHGGGEHQRLPVGRKLGDDFADVVDETHVEHAVGFVEHETFDAVKPKRVALDEIEEPARRGDENIDAVHEQLRTCAPIDTPPITSADLSRRCRP